jgi:ABC-type Zn uptake system ZnuABC Zn-binding protein ZnuA
LTRRIMRGLILASILASTLLTVDAGTSLAQEGPPAPLKVLATTTQIQDFVRNVGGSRITVIPVLGGDEDAHGYQPTATDARNVAGADLILQNGVGLEPWFERLAQNARPGAPILKLGEVSGIPLRRGDAETPMGDPHVWFDPTNVQRMVNAIRDALIALDPAGQDVYTANAAAYNAQLDDLDAQIMAMWAAVPSAQRRLVTNHDAFGYYIDRYGLTFVGSIIPSMSTDAEASAFQVQLLVRLIRQQGVRAIFAESSLNPRLAQAISQQTGVRIYSSLYGDSLGKPGSSGDTYIKMMLSNTQTMIEGMTR